MSRVGERLRHIVPQGRGEQKALAYLAGITTASLSKILKGKTKEPGFETVAKIAKALDLSLDSLAEGELGEPRDISARLISETDRRRIAEFIGWIGDRFLGDHGSKIASVTTPQTVEEKLEYANELMTKANVVRLPERTMPRRTPEFDVDPTDFNDAGDTDFPLELHGQEQEDFEAAAGVAGFEIDMGTTLLNSREVRSGKIRTVRVRGDSMSPKYEEGWKLAVDVTNKRPKNRQPVLVYRKEVGTMIGYYFERRGRMHLLKANRSYEPIELRADDQIVGVIVKLVDAPADEATDEMVAELFDQSQSRKKR